MNQLKTIALLAVLSALLVVISHAVIGGMIGAGVGLAIAASVNLGAWFYSDQIALKAYGAKPPTAAQAQLLQPMLQRLCNIAQLPLPQLFVIPTSAANAFATGRNPQNAAVAFTEGLLYLLTPEELEAVMAHELSHIRYRDTLTQTVAAAIAGGISFLVQLAQSGIAPIHLARSRHSNPLVLLLTVIFAPLAAIVLQMTLSRTREFAADAGAAELTGNPRALVTALQKLTTSAQTATLEGNPAFAPLLIVNAFTQEFLSNLFSTHPPTNARVAELLKLAQSPQVNRASGAASMNVPSPDPIPDNLAPEVLERAARLYSQRQQSYSVEELMQAGAEAQIPPELVQQAIQEMQAQQRQRQILQAQRRERVKWTGAIALGGCVVVCLWAGWTYNTLNQSATSVDAKWAQVENQLQRRADLIPNLVNITQTYAQPEPAIITQLKQSRESYLHSSTPEEKLAANSAMLQAIGQFQTYTSTHSQLQSNQVVINLQYELAGSENRLATERMRYNEAVQTYNQTLRSFPVVLVAQSFGFKPKSFFQANQK